MKNRGFAEYIVIVILALVAIMGLLYWQSASAPAPVVTLTSPNGGEAWEVGTTQTITWNTVDVPEDYKVSVSIVAVPPSTEAGQEFDPLVFVDIANDGSEEWVISDMYPEGNYALEVTAYKETPIVDGNHVSDVSDASFIITKPEMNAADLIVGTWQSVDDEKAVVAYNADGTTEDTYDGEGMGTGTWSLDALTLNTILNEETFTYMILNITDGELEMSYLPRGNILRYVRVAE